jgi:hypothetical protein
MGDQLANNPEALRLFFTDDIYLVQQEAEESFTTAAWAMDLADANSKASLTKMEGSGIVDVAASMLGLPDGVVGLPKSNVNPLATIAGLPVSIVNLTANEPNELEQAIPENTSLVQETPISYNAGAEQAMDLNLIQETQANTLKQEPSFIYRGKNGRNVLILVYDEVNDVTTEEGREVFKNIVKAKNLSADDYAIVNYASYNTSSFNELRRFFNAKVILAFGVNSLQLGILDYPQHTIINHEGVQLMFSADLHELSMDLKIKRALWTALKDMEL